MTSVSRWDASFLVPCLRNSVHFRNFWWGINLVHFLFVSQTAASWANLPELFSCIGEQLSMPLTEEKTESPVQTITYLGLEIDTIAMQVRIPQGKVTAICTVLLQRIKRWHYGTFSPWMGHWNLCAEQLLQAVHLWVGSLHLLEGLPNLAIRFIWILAPV